MTTSGPRAHPVDDHCQECCTDPACQECWPVALSIESHQLYPSDPLARAHEPSAGCWCEPVVQVVHRAPAVTDVPALREAGAL